MLDTHVWLKVLLRCLTSEAIFRSDVYKKVWSPSVFFLFRSFEHLNYIFDPKKLLQWQQHQCI